MVRVMVRVRVRVRVRVLVSVRAGVSKLRLTDLGERGEETLEHLARGEGLGVRGVGARGLGARG